MGKFDVRFVARKRAGYNLPANRIQTLAYNKAADLKVHECLREVGIK
jgi:hypothetical protein